MNLSFIKFEDGVYFFGVFFDLEVLEIVEQDIKDNIGELVLGRCQCFKRVFIYGEVFYFKLYGRVFRRNSYIVIFEDSQKVRKCG